MILVCGESRRERAEEAAAHAGPAGRAFAGGSPVLLAAGLLRLGVPAAILREGAGEAAAPRAEDAENEADDLPVLPRSEEALPAQVRAIAFRVGPLTAGPAGRADAALAEREAGGRVISVSLGLPAVARAPEAGIPPAERLLRAADHVTARDQDLRRALGLEPAEAAWLLLGRGASLVTVTLAGRGALAFAPGCAVSLPAPASAAAGAAEMFQAALLARLFRTGRMTGEGLAGLDAEALGDLLAYAGAASALACAPHGAALPSAAEVEARLQPAARRARPRPAPRACRPAGPEAAEGAAPA
ncbi:hypothetical protein [Methylobacterium sp. WSM2598]|uniref:hypothetical protein n=1 Tax=Methylobacterium sp. WSM2598 TaxID=398261 RepID=UPI0003638C1E|nr:hypothetical protein [Methylobacterium sp. WSM2598]